MLHSRSLTRTPKSLKAGLMTNLPQFLTLVRRSWNLNQPQSHFIILDAAKPEEWDDAEDGDWIAPTVPNPKCTEGPGCGEWKR